MKKFTKPMICVVLALAMALGAMTVFANNPTFTDVPTSHYAFNAIENAVANGMVTGVGNNQFAPDGEVTVSQFVTILTRAVYASELETVTPGMSNWWAKNMAVAQNHRILDGTAVDKMYFGSYMWPVGSVEKALTRYDAAQIVSNFMATGYSSSMATDAELAAVTSSIGDYSSIPDNYRDAVRNMYVLGILKGVDKTGRFGGEATLTRAQACIMLGRLFVVINNTQFLSQCVYETETATRFVPDSTTTTTPEPNPDPNPTETPDTGSYTAGYLSNGKPITEENIKELLGEIEEMYPEDTPWSEDPKYDRDTTLFGRAGGCASFASMVSDLIFGKDAPVTVHTNYDGIKVGDVIWGINSENGYNHVVVVTDVDYENGSYKACSGNYGDEVTWRNRGQFASYSQPSASESRVYSRY